MNDLRRINNAPFNEINIPYLESIGEPFELEYVPIENLVFNDAYQRQIDNRGRRNIKKIVEGFQWGRFSPLIVARHGDDFAVIDGQHRSHAAALVGISHVPALVTEMTVQEQASAFSWINGSVTDPNLPRSTACLRAMGGSVQNCC